MERALPQSSPIRDALVLELLLLPLWYLALPLVPLAFSGGYTGSAWLAKGLLLAFYAYPLGILLGNLLALVCLERGALRLARLVGLLPLFMLSPLLLLMRVGAGP
jgi:hypothetical protein